MAVWPRRAGPFSPLQLHPHHWGSEGLRAAGFVSKELLGPAAHLLPRLRGLSSDLIACEYPQVGSPSCLLSTEQPRAAFENTTVTPACPGLGSSVTLHSVKLDLAEAPLDGRAPVDLASSLATTLRPLDHTIYIREGLTDTGPQFPSHTPPEEVPVLSLQDLTRAPSC